MQSISKIIKTKYVSHGPITKAMHLEHHNCWCISIPFACSSLNSLGFFPSISCLLSHSCLIFCAYPNPVCPWRSDINSILLQSIVWSLLNQVTPHMCYLFDRIPVPIVIYISSEAFTYFILSANNSTFTKQQ